MSPDQSNLHNQYAASPEHQAEITAFWEQGRSRPAEKFTDQIAALQDGTDERPGVIYAKSSAILAGTVMASTMTEGEAMLELNDFVHKLETLSPEQAGTLNPAYNQDPSTWTANFRANFSFLGSKEYQQAVQGVAVAWLDYLGQSPDHILNVFDPNTQAWDGAHHSYGQVFRDIVTEVSKDPANAALLANLRIDPREWEDTPAAKLIIVDDYSASGNILSKLLKMAKDVANHQQPDIAEGLLGKAEAHVLIASDKQTTAAAKDERGHDIAVPIRAYFGVQTQDSAWSSFSSFYSSMDYGFGSDLQRYVLELNQHGEDLREPFLVNIDPPYSSDLLVRDEVGARLLTECAAQNAEEFRLDQGRRQVQAKARLDYMALQAARGTLYANDYDAYRAELRRLDDRDEALMLEYRAKINDWRTRSESTRAAITTRKRELGA